jgi:uncharacterized protein (TIGR03435 family)
MTHKAPAAGKVLDQFFARASRPSAEQIARSRRNILAVLDVTVDASTRTPARKRASRFALPAAAAAMVIILVGTAVIPRDEAPMARTVNDGLERSEAPALIPAGQTIEPGERIHSRNGGMFRLADGSRVEMRPDSDLSLERAEDGVRINLSDGGIVVYATEQRTGHLYVQTRDLTVSVVGTVFLVNAEEQGSRVAVIAGEVLVRQGARIQRLLPGEHVVTNSEMSAEAPPRLALLQQSAVLVGTPDDVFEENSIRPSTPILRQLGPRGNYAVAEMPGTRCLTPETVQLNPGRLIVSRANLRALVGAAYGNLCPLEDVLAGGPDWARSSMYEIQALIPPGSPAYSKTDFLEGRAPKLQRMLQNLLTERFKLRLSREIREVAGYNLVLVKEGKLQLSEDQTGATKKILPMDAGVSMFAAGSSMANFASFVMNMMGATVVDQTGIKGLHDFALIFPPDQSVRPPADVDEMLRDMRKRNAEVLPAALEEQLGLRLVPARLSVEFLTIEYVEKPSEN